MSAATKLLLLRPRGVSPLNYLRSLSGKIVLWATQETTGTVAIAENDAMTVPDTKQLMIDGDMEAATAAAYTQGTGTILSKEAGTRTGGSGSTVLRITRDGATNARASQVILDAIADYLISGWARSDSNGTPRVVTASILWSGDATTPWESFSVAAAPAGATGLALWNSSGVNGQYVEFDDVLVQQTGILASSAFSTPGDNPIDAAISGATIGQPMGPFGFGYSYDAVNDFLNWYSAEVNSMWNPGEDFSIQIAFTSTSWAAGTATLFMAKADANNFISITRNAADLIFNYTAGGTPKTVTIATGSPTGNNTAWLTVNISGDALNGYFNGVAGTPATTLGTFVGNFGATTCTVGASSTAGGDPWGGLGSQPYICDVVRTQTEITTHSNIAGV